MMENFNYSQKVMEYFMNPRNVGERQDRRCPLQDLRLRGSSGHKQHGDRDGKGKDHRRGLEDLQSSRGRGLGGLATHKDALLSPGRRGLEGRHRRLFEEVEG